MNKLAFIVPAYQRYDLTAMCLRQLRRTCDQLLAFGIKATAVVIADDDNLNAGEAVGFATVQQANQPLGRKWNDGIEYACAYLGADYVVPFGTDNWVDARLIATTLPARDQISARRLFTMIHQDGERIATCRVTYPGGDGIRTMPSSLLKMLDYRPCDEDKARATDTSMRDRLATKLGRHPDFIHTDLHPFQIVSFQSAEQQLNDWDDLLKSFGIWQGQDPWAWLAKSYPVDAVDDAREVYARRLVAA